MLPFCIKDPKPAMWKVGGIKIERTRARNFFFEDGQGNQLKRNFFTIGAVARKRREVLGWAIKVKRHIFGIFLVISELGWRIYIVKSTI